MRILWINPITSSCDTDIKKILESIRRPDAQVDVTHLSKGPAHLMYKHYEAVVLVEILKIVRRAEEGYDAVIIGCFDDPGLEEARELVSIPVIGPGETCMHMACTLGDKFTIIGGQEAAIPRIEKRVRMHGLEKRLASFRPINFTVPMMAKDPQKTMEAIEKEARKAIEEDHAEVIVLGCTVESGYVKTLIERLRVPVIDAVVVTFAYAQMLADLYRKIGLSHSKILGYKSPPEGEILV
jgi:allantoin racemase